MNIESSEKALLISSADLMLISATSVVGFALANILKWSFYVDVLGIGIFLMLSGILRVASENITKNNI